LLPFGIEASFDSTTPGPGGPPRSFNPQRTGQFLPKTIERDFSIPQLRTLIIYRHRYYGTQFVDNFLPLVQRQRR